MVQTMASTMKLTPTESTANRKTFVAPGMLAAQAWMTSVFQKQAMRVVMKNSVLRKGPKKAVTVYAAALRFLNALKMRPTQRPIRRRGRTVNAKVRGRLICMRAVPIGSMPKHW